MRRGEREVTKIEDLKQIIDDCKVVRIGTIDQEGIYVVPLNFGYALDDHSFKIFVHSAKKGRKVEAFAYNNKVAIEMDCKHALDGEDKACSYTYKYASVIGNGTIRLLSETNEKLDALQAIMVHQVGRTFPLGEQEANMANIYEIDVKTYTGKWNK